MSADTLLAGAHAPTHRRRRALALTIGTRGLPLRAFVASRLVALGSGVIGVLTTVKHDPAAAAQSLHALGPVGYALAGSVDRFDSGYYLDIAAHGYGTIASGKVAFSPLYPFLISALSVVTGGSGVVAGFLISAASFLAALVLLHRLTELELGRRAADAAVLVLAFAPLSFFFTAVYTESLFLALSVGAMLACRQERWRVACLLAALAALTRPTGVLIAVGLAVMHVRRRGGLDRSLAWLVAAPAALVAYLAALVAAGYPWLAPFRAEAKWNRVDVGPLGGLISAVWSAVRGAAGIAGGAPVYHPELTGALAPGAESVVLLAVLLGCVALAVRCWRTLAPEYAVYALVTLLACVSSPAAGQPLWSLDRYALTIFPLAMAGGDWLARRRLLTPVMAISTVLLVFYTIQFSAWAFVA